MNDIRINIPCRSSWPWICFGSQQRELFALGLDRADMAHTPGSPVQVTRNRAVEEFLQSNRSWMLWIDDDIAVPEGAARTMLSTAEEAGPCVVSAICPVIQSSDDGRMGIATNVAIKTPHGTGWLSWSEVEGRQEPFDVISCGAGCILVHRSIYEAIEYPWFEWVQNPHVDLGEDCYFGEKVLQNGFRIIADPRVWCEHYNTVPLLELAKTYAMGG